MFRSWFAVCLALSVFLMVGASTAEAQRYRRGLWDFDPDAINGFEPEPPRDDIVPGEFIVDPPTLENLGFRWYVQGDSNRNASVEVSYRRKGETQWREAQPLLRVHHEIVMRFFWDGRPRHYRTGNLFAGSVFFLDPGTDYEVRFVMTDPDGGAPNEPKVVTVATRSEPQAWSGGRTLHVYPQGFRGRRGTARAFTNVKAAYEAALPGDTILLHAGVHRADDAPYTLAKSGEEGKPIVFSGVGAEKTVLEGPDLETDLLHVAQADHLVFQDMTLRRADTAIAAGEKHGPGASWLTVRRCRIEDVIKGIWTFSENSRNWYIADNVITGTDDTWYPRPSDGTYMEGSHTGVNVYGQGHVVCYNRISRFSDALAIANFGHPPNDVRKHGVNIDFYNNDLSFATDDNLETDSGCHNIRAYRNLCYTSCTALSVQPSYGGPIYLIRNVGYGNTYHMYKWNNQPTGVVAYHNTGTRGLGAPHWSNGHLRNNLSMGSISSGTYTPDRTTMDYNGWRGSRVKWLHGQPDDRDNDRHGRLVYESFADFTAATGYERHGVSVDYDVFANLSPPEPGKTYSSADIDVRLKPGSKAVDAGVHLPNINDGYHGEAPDLGAVELGAPLPHYGPRDR